MLIGFAMQCPKVQDNIVYQTRAEQADRKTTSLVMGVSILVVSRFLHVLTNQAAKIIRSSPRCTHRWCPKTHDWP
jgi:hypothetical protein